MRFGEGIIGGLRKAEGGMDQWGKGGKIESSRGGRKDITPGKHKLTSTHATQTFLGQGAKDYLHIDQ